MLQKYDHITWEQPQSGFHSQLQPSSLSRSSRLKIQSSQNSAPDSKAEKHDAKHQMEMAQNIIFFGSQFDYIS